MSEFDLSELPQALSGAERASLVRHAQGTGPRALALIDALTALVAEQAAQLVADSTELAVLRTSLKRATEAEMSAEDRVRELEREQLMAKGVIGGLVTERDAAERKLADANARIAHLAAQPAAPSRPERG